MEKLVEKIVDYMKFWNTWTAKNMTCKGLHVLEKKEDNKSRQSSRVKEKPSFLSWMCLFLVRNMCRENPNLFWQDTRIIRDKKRQRQRFKRISRLLFLSVSSAFVFKDSSISFSTSGKKDSPFDLISFGQHESSRPVQVLLKQLQDQFRKTDELGWLQLHSWSCDDGE